MVVDTVGSQYFQDSDRSIGSTAAHIPTYTVVDPAGDFVIAGRLWPLAGISNLTNRLYYSRVFLVGGMKAEKTGPMWVVPSHQYFTPTVAYHSRGAL